MTRKKLMPGLKNGGLCYKTLSIIGKPTKKNVLHPFLLILYYFIVRERVHKGVPDCLRIMVWPKLAEIEKFKLSENLNFHVLFLIFSKS